MSPLCKQAGGGEYEKSVANGIKTTTVVVADTTITTEETVSPTLYVRTLWCIDCVN